MDRIRPEPITPEPIAIVGIGCRFPGGIDTLDRFWEMLRNGEVMVDAMPANRFGASVPGAAQFLESSAPRGGFLTEIDQFDTAFFGISPLEAEKMDPQQRLLLECSWEALENAGIPRGQLAGSRTGVFVGMWTGDYEELVFRDRDALDLYCTTGSGRYAASGRLSYFYNLRGPSITVDTACSSSLVALHLACQSIRSGDSETALVGAVNIILSPTVNLGYSRAGMLSAEGLCKFGDASASGYVRSEGCAVLLLKPLSRAREAKDPILAIIRGSAVNNDGQGSGSLMAPSGEGQAEMLRLAYETSGVRPTEIGYFEAHGTGTNVGDPVELNAIAEILRKEGTLPAPIRVGSVKSNLGHTESAAGLAGVIKVILSMKHGQIPPSLHVDKLNEAVPWHEGILRIPTTLEAWESEGPRLGAVSGFGIVGTNAHVILEEAPALHQGALQEDAGSQAPDILTLSAQNPKALRALVERTETLLRGGEIDLADLCNTLARHRTHLRERLALVAIDRTTAADLLAAALKGARLSGESSTTNRISPASGIVFVFPGQGAQWHGMARSLYERFQPFRTAFDAVDAAIVQEAGFSPKEILFSSDATWLTEIDRIQPITFAIQVALAALWRACGMEPAACIGHSMGEVAAAHVCGYLSLADATRIICRRSRLLLRVRGQGAMALVELPQAETQREIDALDPALADTLSVAVANSPTSTVIAGAPDAVQMLVALLQERGLFARQIKVDVASHSPQMDPLLAPLLEELGEITPLAGTVRFLSTVTGEAFAPDGGIPPLSAAYWANNLRQPVQFGAAVQQAIAAGDTHFVELSPHPLLVAAIEENLAFAQRAGSALPSMTRDETVPCDTFLRSLAELYMEGADIRWAALYPHAIRPLQGLPNYPWQRRSYWIQSAAPERTQSRPVASHDSPLGERLPQMATLPHLNIWQREAPRNASAHPYAFSSALALTMALQAAQTHFNAPVQLSHTLLTELPGALEGEDFALQTTLDGAENSGSCSIHWRSADDQDASLPWQLLLQTTAHASDATAGVATISWHKVQQRIALGEGASIVVDEGWALHRMEQGETETAVGDAIEAALEAIRTLAVNPAIQIAAIERVWLSEGKIAWLHMEALPDASGYQATGFDAEGSPVLALEGVTVRTPSLTTRIGDAAQQSAEWRYVTKWVPAPTSGGGQTQPLGHALLLGGSAGMASRFQSALYSRGIAATHFPATATAPDATAIDPQAIADLAARTAAEGKRLEILYLAHAGEVAAEPASDGSTESLQVVERLLGLLSLAQSEALAAQQIRIWLVTQDAALAPANNNGAASVEVAQVALWGAGRVIANEAPNLWGGAIDVEPNATEAELNQAIQWMEEGGSGLEVALRSGQLLAPRLARDNQREMRPPPIRSDAAYLITGGAGAIGAGIAHLLAEAGAGHLVLVGRRTQDEAITALCAALGAKGAKVRYRSLHIEEMAEVQRLFDELAAEQIPLAGVIHSAGVLRDAPLAAQERTALVEVLHPKIAGAWNLHLLTRNLPLDFFMLVSSISALMGNPGQANYAAANLWLNGLAHLRNRLGLPGVSVNWGEWAGDGLADTDRSRASLAIMGLEPMATEVGLGAMFGLLAAKGEIAVAKVDWLAFKRRLPTARTPALFAELIAEHLEQVGEARGAQTNELLERALGAPPARRIEMMTRYVAHCTAEIMRFDDASDVGADRGFFQLGMDSLMAMRLRNQIGQSLGLSLPATIAFNFNTPRLLAQHLAELLYPAAASAAPNTANPVAPEPAAADSVDEDLAELSLEELQDLLDMELDTLET